MKLPFLPLPVEILLADDDNDDRFFFNQAINSLPFQTHFTTVEDGEKLMKYLFKNSTDLPNVLFLDYNMPRKNGLECLVEIKSHPKLSVLPVIIYSTYLDEDVADMFYKNGAHFYIRKTEFEELKKLLSLVLTRIVEDRFVRPSRGNFILSLLEA